MKPASVSVVIPCLNAGPWIGETLASVVAQGDMVAELIVVDDGSTDDSAQQALARSPGVRLLQGAGKGPSAARNLGWRHARSPWIQFLDADDLLVPGKLATQADACSTGPMRAAVVYSPWQRYGQQDDQWRPIGQPAYPELGPAPLDRLLDSEHFIQLGAALFSREWLERVGGFDERYRFIEDVELMIRIAIAGGCFIQAPARRPLLFYRQLPGSLSQSDDRAFIEGCVRNAQLVERHWRERDELTPARAATLARVYYLATRFYFTRDRERFEALARTIDALGPGVLPAGPPLLRALTRVLGYRRAEQMALVYRRAKAALGLAVGQAARQ